MVNSLSSPALANCTFAGNRVTGQRGNLYNADNSTSTVVNSIFWDAVGGEIVNVSSSVTTLRNCIVQSGSCRFGSGDGPWHRPARSSMASRGWSGYWGLRICRIHTALLSPENGATGVSLNPALETGEFSHPAGLTQIATEWQVGTDETFGSGIVVDETSDTALTAFTLSDEVLENGTTYHWRVRFQDSDGNWSHWSNTWSFTPFSAGGGGGGCQTGSLPGLFALFLPLILFFRFKGKAAR